MAKHRVKFTFPAERVPDPIIYLLGKDFDVVTNLRRADVGEDRGWVVMEVEGEEANIEKGLEWVRSRGVRVDPLGGDIVAG